MADSLQHPLRGLLIAQFCGAFNDNAWKLMVALLAIRHATSQMAPGPELETAAQTQTAIAFVIFTVLGAASEAVLELGPLGGPSDP